MQNMERTGVGMLTTFKTKVLCSPKRSQLFNYKTSEPSGSKTAEIYIYIQRLKSNENAQVSVRYINRIFLLQNKIFKDSPKNAEKNGTVAVPGS